MPVIVNIKDRRWNAYKINCTAIAEKALVHENRGAEVSITLTNDAELQKLNKKYRRIDAPTNVLSFETGDEELLGDVFISFDAVAREARCDGFAKHATHLLVHGILHLQGFDHIDERDAKIMERKEVKILREMKIKNPYKEPFAVMKKVGLFLLGVIGVFGLAPHYLWWATALSIGAAYYLSKDRGYGFGFWWGAGYGAASFHWSLESIFANTEIARQMWYFYPIGLVGLALASGIVFGLPFFMTAKTESSGWRRTVYFALAWTFILWLREWFLTGCPLNPVANITLPFPAISGSMSVIGALGLTFVLVGAICSIPEFLRTKNKWQFLFFFPLLMAPFIGRIVLTAPVSNNLMTVRIVQPSFDMNRKFDGQREDRMNLLVDMSKGAKADLIIWPETSYPYIAYPGKKLPALGVPLAAGAVYSDYTGTFNAMLLADKDGNVADVYLKAHLVPFGEYRVLWKLVPAIANLTPGPGPKLMGGFAPAICYEIIFSDSLLPAGALPRFILNISNDGWFGNSSGPHQHLDMARRQAIETGLPIVRANHSGISAIIDASGRIVKSLPLDMVGVLDGEVPPASLTVYRRIGLNGTMLIIVLVCGLLLLPRPRFCRRQDDR
ncbi:MAG: apolipoprotein N-acyltransferase [Rickettsiales bacterium]|jgi:apolipoprotein N-acyltransferase|nr:apolipoprotein N-acyltransferase [Rickettsiales bacterium]